MVPPRMLTMLLAEKVVSAVVSGFCGGESSRLFKRKLFGGLVQAGDSSKVSRVVAWIVGAVDSLKESQVAAQWKQPTHQKRVMWQLDLSSQLFERELGGGSFAAVGPLAEDQVAAGL